MVFFPWCSLREFFHFLLAFLYFFFIFSINFPFFFLQGIIGVILSYFFLPFFQGHFFPNTKINGVDCGLQNQEDAFQTVSDYLSTYKLTVHSEDGDLTVGAKDVELSYKNSDDLDRLLKGQDYDRWFMNLNSAYNYQVMETKVDDKALTRAVQSLKCMNPS